MQHTYEEPYLKPYRWVIVVLLWLLYLAFGLIARSVSPLVTPILQDLDISYGQMGVILGSWQLSYIAFAIIAGTVIDKWGVRRTLFLATIVIGLSAALRYFANGFGTLLSAVALFGVGGSLISIGGPKVISVWFQGKSRGLAIGIYMTGSWIGGILVLATTNSFVMPLTGNSWRLTFVYYGLLAFVIALLWWLLARDVKPTGGVENVNTRELLGRLSKVRNVRVALVVGLMSFAIVHGFTNWLPKILESSGFSPSTAGFAASIPFFAGIPAILVIPRMVPAHLRGRAIALLALLVSVALLMSATAAGVPLLAGLAFFGITASSLFPLMLLILMETPEVGSRYVGSVSGLYFCVAEIGGFTGPLIIGALVDMTGAFLPGLVFLAGLSLGIFAVTFLLKAPSVSNPKEL